MYPYPHNTRLALPVPRAPRTRRSDQCACFLPRQSVLLSRARDPPTSLIVHTHRGGKGEGMTSPRPSNLLDLPDDILADALCRWLPTPIAIEFYYRTCKHLRVRCADRAARVDPSVAWAHVADSWSEVYSEDGDPDTLTYRARIPHYRLIMPCRYGVRLSCWDGYAEAIPAVVVKEGWAHPTLPTHFSFRDTALSDALCMLDDWQRLGVHIECVYLKLDDAMRVGSTLGRGDLTFPTVQSVAVKYPQISSADQIAIRARYLKQRLSTAFPNARLESLRDNLALAWPEHNILDLTWAHHIRDLLITPTCTTFAGVSDDGLRILFSRVKRVLVQRRHSRVDYTAAAARLLSYVPPGVEVRYYASEPRDLLNYGARASEIAARITHIQLRVVVGATADAEESVDRPPERWYADYTSVHTVTVLAEPMYGTCLEVRLGYWDMDALAQLGRDTDCAVYETSTHGRIPHCAMRSKVEYAEHGLRLVWNTVATPKQLKYAVRGAMRLLAATFPAYPTQPTEAE
jgi:hypothetical protein